jgi:hypothetical protein
MTVTVNATLNSPNAGISVTSTGPSGAITSKSGTITTGGTSQILSANNAVRKHFEVQNPSTATENLYIGFGVTAINPATPTTIIRILVPGQSYNMDVPGFISTDQINVYAATTAHTFYAGEA